MKYHFLFCMKSTNNILFSLTAHLPTNILNAMFSYFTNYLSRFFVQFINSYLRVIYRIKLNPCPLIIVPNFASHQGIIFLNKFFKLLKSLTQFSQLCINIVPVTSNNMSFREQMHDGET